MWCPRRCFDMRALATNNKDGLSLGYSHEYMASDYAKSSSQDLCSASCSVRCGESGERGDSRLTGQMWHRDASSGKPAIANDLRALDRLRLHRRPKTIPAVQLVHHRFENQGNLECAPLRPLLSHTQCHPRCLFHCHESKAQLQQLLSLCGDAHWAIFRAGSILSTGLRTAEVSLLRDGRF